MITCQWCWQRFSGPWCCCLLEKREGDQQDPCPQASARSRLSSSVHTPGCLGSRCATRGRETWAMTFTRCLPFNYTVKETSVLFPNCLFESGVMCRVKKQPATELMRQVVSPLPRRWTHRRTGCPPTVLPLSLFALPYLLNLKYTRPAERRGAP